MAWTEDKVGELRRLWELGLSASAIGKQLGVSKNAVVGKAHRLKLPSRPSPIREGRSAPRRPRATPKVVRPKLRAIPRPQPKRRPMPLSTRGHTCQWPIGDPTDEDFRFCGSAAVEGKPYCEEHCERAYITRNKGDTAVA